MDKLVEPYLKKIPVLSDISLENITIQKLAGLTNHNFLLTIDNSSFVLRIPSQSTNSTIDRSNEAWNQQIAYDLGISPQVLWRESNTKNITQKLTGASLSAFLNNTKVLSTQDLHDDSITSEIATSLRKLQNSSQPLKGIIDNSSIQKHMKHYFDLCTSKQQSLLQDDYQSVMQLLQTKGSSKPKSHQLVPSHGDLVLENILIDNTSHEEDSTKLSFIDWEYSAMASPFWDMATLSNAAKLSDTRAVAFMEMVFHESQSDDVERLEQYRYIVKTLSDCWYSAYRSTG